MEQLSLELETVMEVVNVYQEVKERPANYETRIMSSEHAGMIGRNEIGNSVSEQLLVVVLNTKNEINAIHKVFAGSLNQSVAHPRDIFRTAIMNNGARIFVYHNHPSGDTEPSEADIAFTRRIAQAGEIMGIELLDHIIVTADDSLSLRSEGYI